MKHETAFALVAEICPAQAGLLWDTTNHDGCDTATAVADQYADDEITEARQALARLAEGDIPDGWEWH